ncbi:MAG: hypothetical protein ACM3PF_00270 [Bacteroidota bacterium]
MPGSRTGSPRATAQDSTVYVDTARNVHIVDGGRDVRITHDGRYRDAKRSLEGGAIGALVTSTLEPDMVSRDSLEVAEVLLIWRGGRVIRRFTPGGYIRAWSFANRGHAVAVYSGALHFAGFYVLYDLSRGREVANAEDPVTDRSPEWVRSLAP